MADAERAFAEQSLTREQGRHPRMRLSQVQMRLGSRFFSVWWLLPGLLMLAVASVAAGKVFIATGAGQSLIHGHPCVPHTPRVSPGVQWWVVVTHVANFFFMVMIIRAGWQILADHPRLYAKVHCTPDREVLRFRGPVPKDRVWTAKDDAVTLSPLFGMPGGRHTIGVARHWHFIFDILFVVNGIAYVVLLFATGRYLKLVPTELSILPDAGSCIVQYSALHLPAAPGGYVRFDAIQQLSYFGVVFLLGPLAILSGLAMSPALDNRFQWYQRIFGNRQAARTLHFLIMCAFLLFYAVHMTMVAATGFADNLDSIALGSRGHDLNGVALLFVALGVTIAFNVWAVRFSWTHTRVLQRVSNATVGRLMDLLFDHYAPRAEYREQDISPFFWPNGLVPTSDEWTGLRDREFRDYRLRVHGLVEHPVELSLRQLRELAHQDQITMHNCIQGWSAIGRWSGVPFTKLIELVRPQPEARWVMFYSYGEGGEGGQYYDSHTVDDLRHPQSLLAYEMNGEPLPLLHGAPLRLRVENQLGFKHVKWIKEIEFVRHFSERGGGEGGYNEDHEFYGYRDEI
ncbi:molybdopterin-dependent oxidoreductase [Baekduia soli]|uniref:Molybdopterin-dependent oxidoreductase n=1 Tax=Baekduia soli TaxID=496014 RepID=A0A5B8U098_9ACTN|nr:molybdopterin-dependent oxidoreductase [Baekduia soli]QEC46404.1 molybdopterin-dependent oxidoreductase [Baekduia soli]